MNPLVVMLITAFAVAFLLFCPVVFKLSYKEEFTLKLRYLFITKTIYPSKEKQSKKERKPKKSKTNEQKEKKKENGILKTKLKNDGIVGFLEAVFESFRKLSDLPQFIKKHILISLLQINITVSSDNAADTAVGYGKLCALVYPSVTFLANNFRHKKIDLDIHPDFDKTENDININIFFKIKLIFLLIGIIKGIISGVSIIKLFSENSENTDTKTKDTIKKETAENERTSN